MPTRSDGSARERVLRAAMDLFGRNGFRATTIAQIEAAAGLSPGAGGVYRHVRSKEELLEEGLRRQIDQGPSLLELLEAPESFAQQSARDQLLAIARAALLRLEQERDLNRLLVRDLAQHPELLARVRDHELRTVHGALVRWLESRGVTGPDVGPLATVLMGAVSHYWIMADVFSGEHPLTPDRDAFLAALVDLVARLLPEA